MEGPTLLEPGAPAPEFTFRDADGSSRSTSSLKGEPFLVYFYPKDDTPGCTKEACAFRDAQPQLLEIGLTVIGVSCDDEDSHDRFRRKFNLPFPLASDNDRGIVNAYGVWGPKKFMGKSYEGIHRVSYLIGRDGRIAKVYPKVKPEDHAQEVLEDLRALSL